MSAITDASHVSGLRQSDSPALTIKDSEAASLRVVRADAASSYYVFRIRRGLFLNEHLLDFRFIGTREPSGIDEEISQEGNNEPEAAED